MLTAPEQAAEHLGRFLEPLTPAVFHHRDELLVNLIEHGLRISALALTLVAKGVEKTLVVTGGQQATLNAELVHQAGETKAIHQHADAAHNTGLVHVNLVGSHGDVISSRCTGFFNHGVHRLLVLGFETQDFVIHHAGLHRAAAGGVDQQDHGAGAFVLKGGAQS